MPLLKQLRRRFFPQATPEEAEKITIALSESPAVCARCRRKLRKNSLSVRGGRARARNATRDAKGRFLTDRFKLPN